MNTQIWRKRKPTRQKNYVVNGKIFRTMGAVEMYCTTYGFRITKTETRGNTCIISITGIK